MTEPTKKDTKRWAKKARLCFTLRAGFKSGEEQDRRLLDLARDIYRTTDPDGFYDRDAKKD